MKRLFLTSSFTPVADFLPEFIGEDLTNKRITFITTASVPKKSRFYVKWAKEKLISFGLIIDELEISTASFEQIKTTLVRNDYIFVCGGNPIYLLDQLQKKNVFALLTEQINQGKIYIGESSGSVILSKNIQYIEPLVGPEIVDPITDFSGLNLIDFYPTPHYQTFPYVESCQKIMTMHEDKLNVIPITNNQVILVNDNNYEIKTVTK
jgi:dipeptidase E